MLALKKQFYVNNNMFFLMRKSSTQWLEMRGSMLLKLNWLCKLLLFILPCSEVWKKKKKQNFFLSSYQQDNNNDYDPPSKSLLHKINLRYQTYCIYEKCIKTTCRDWKNLLHKMKIYAKVLCMKIWYKTILLCTL